MANRELACVAGVWKGREREFWEREFWEREFQAREKREGRARKQTRAWSRALIPFPFPFPTPATQVNRELEQRRRRRLQEPQKQKLLIGKTTTLHVPHAFLYISLPSLRDYVVTMPNFTFCGGRVHKTTTFFFFCWTFIQSFRIQIQKKLLTFDGTERDGKSAIKFDTFRLQSPSRSVRGEFFLVLRDIKEERRKKVLS